jgi:hypothetical protein
MLGTTIKEHIQLKWLHSQSIVLYIKIVTSYIIYAGLKAQQLPQTTSGENYSKWPIFAQHIKSSHR